MTRLATGKISKNVLLSSPMLSELIQLLILIIIAVLLVIMANISFFVWCISTGRISLDLKNRKLDFVPTIPGGSITGGTRNGVLLNSKKVTTILVPATCKLDFDEDTAATTEKESVKVIKSALYKMFYQLNPNLPKIKAKKSRQSLSKEVDNIVRENTSSVTHIATSFRDYLITPENFEDVILSITRNMGEYCDESSFLEFQKIVRKTIEDGLVCKKEVYEDNFLLSSITDEYIFLVRFRIKISRTLKGWILSYPEISAIYASFILKAKLQHVMKSIRKDVDGDYSSDSSREHKSEIDDRK